MSALKSTEYRVQITENRCRRGIPCGCPKKNREYKHRRGGPKECREQSTIIAYMSSWSAANQRSTPEGTKVKDLKKASTDNRVQSTENRVQ